MEKYSMNKNVLITSISKKVPLIKAVKRGVNKISSAIKVYGGDVDSNCLGQYFVDSFWKMPKLSNLSSKDLLEFCHQNNIGLIIPTRDGELEYFAMLKEELKAVGLDVMVSELKSITNSLDKLTFASLEKIKSIPASQNIDNIMAEAFVVKERYGAGAKSIGINLNKSEALNHARNLEHPIFQPYVKGDEISVDSYITREGDIKGIVMRKRDLVVRGESQITSTFFDENLEIIFKDIFTSLNLYGHVILQAIIDEKKDVHVIECNARFGGASTLSLQAGLDSFYWAYLESIGNDLDEYPFLKSDERITQIRHPEDYYI
jgi:carbamoyl-phosphate synthase large subunit